MMLHDKSCMLDSMCQVLNISHCRAIVWLGHDGSERGFHSQEMVELALIEGFPVTEIQRNPIGVNPVTGEQIRITFPRGNDVRFASHLAHGNGVVMGSKLGKPHAVAWVDRVAIDPANGINFRILTEERELIEEFFVPMTFLQVTTND